MKFPSLLLLIIALLWVPLQLSAQKVKKSSGTYQLSLTNSDFSESEACQYCQEMAMIDAIEKAFGRVVIQGNSTVVENTTTGETTETKQIFNMIAETYVNGDWVETLDESCERFVYEDEFWIKCKVRGKVQELTQPKIDLIIKPLDCESVSCETTEFKEAESFYLYFKSPVDGYVTVYLSDPGTAQRLLPYREMPDGRFNAIEVKADQEYILFSQAQDILDLRGYVDEYEMYAASEMDQNRLYVIYSKEPLVKPSLNRDGQDLPMQLSANDFQKWLASQRRYNQDMQVSRLDLTIRK